MFLTKDISILLFLEENYSIKTNVFKYQLWLNLSTFKFYNQKYEQIATSKKLLYIYIYI